jgi:hypothetical protein
VYELKRRGSIGSKVHERIDWLYGLRFARRRQNRSKRPAVIMHINEHGKTFLALHFDSVVGDRCWFTSWYMRENQALPSSVDPSFYTHEKMRTLMIIVITYRRSQSSSAVIVVVIII